MTTSVENLRNRLENFQELNNFFNVNYFKIPRHFVGYKRAANADFLPAICYVPTRKRYLDNNLSESVSIVIQLINRTETNDTFAGLNDCDAVTDLIINSLQNAPIVGDSVINYQIDVINYQIDVINDMAGKFPFFEIEIAVKLEKQLDVYRHFLD